MTSPVDTSVKFFHSKMLGAPVLRGQAGSLIAILDACLVNGWGIQTAASCVVAGGVCTMTFPLDHAALVDAVILVDGASIAALNGEQKVTAIAPNVVKFATAAANGTATGTITAKMAPVGWTKRFSGTNLAVYKSSDVTANGQFLRINDAGGQDARAIGYENMTAVSTGTGLFPASAQLSGGLYWPKSQVSSADPVDWLVVGDSRFFTVLPSPFQGNGPGYLDYKGASLLAFGDPVLIGRNPDPFSTLIIGDDSPVSTRGGRYALALNYNSLRYMPRAASGIGGSVGAQIHSTIYETDYDNPFDQNTGQVMLGDFVVKTGGTNSWRAKLPAILLSPSVLMEQMFDPFSVLSVGTPERSYVTHLTGNSLSQTQSMQLFAIDITGPWR